VPITAVDKLSVLAISSAGTSSSGDKTLASAGTAVELSSSETSLTTESRLRETQVRMLCVESQKRSIN
jgi:hypothetical protein